MSNIHTYLHRRLDHCATETRVPLNLQYFPLRNGTVRRIAMASSLLNFLVWDGSANIAARHSSIRPIGSQVKSRAWSCLTSSFVNIATWKRVTSDCIPRKSVFGLALAPEAKAAREKDRLLADEQKSDRGYRSMDAAGRAR